MITLRLVDCLDARYLYNLLKERTKAQSISHRKMPTFAEHEAFMDSNPYYRWYIIVAGPMKVRVGTIYLTDDREVGIHIKHTYRGRGFGPLAITTLHRAYPGTLYANIAPKNTPSERMFKRLGFKKIQHTYRLDA